MKTNKKLSYFVIFLWLIGLIFMFLGFYYTPSYYKSVFVKYDVIPTSLLNKILFLDILSVCLGLLLILFSRKLVRYKKQIFLLILTFIGCLVIFELLSLFWLCNLATNDQFRSYANFGDCSRKSLYQPHHYLSYVTTPNYESGLNKHNSLGFRGNEIEAKDPGTFRIVALGGSTTYTEKVEDYTKSYPYLLEETLKNDYGYNVEVINAGVGGYNSYETLINFIFRVQELEPDMIIFYEGVNEVQSVLVNPDYFKGDNSGRRKYWSEPRVPLPYKFVLFRILAGTNPFGLEPYTGTDTVIGGVGSPKFNKLLNTTPLDALNRNGFKYFERNIKDMISIANEEDIKVLLATWAYTDTKNDFIVSEHYSKGIKILNDILLTFDSAYVYDFASEMPRDEIYWGDSRHVNEKGSRLKSELFARYINRSDLIPEKYRRL